MITPIRNGQSLSLELARPFIGKEVKITIDQPAQSYYKGAQYEVNYGFVPGTNAPDGDALDAYYLGTDKPLKEAVGICIAIIHRLEDDDDKLIIVPKIMENLTNEEIEAKVNFQEKNFKHVVVRL